MAVPQELHSLRGGGLPPVVSDDEGGGPSSSRGRSVVPVLPAPLHVSILQSVAGDADFPLQVDLGVSKALEVVVVGQPLITDHNQRQDYERELGRLATVLSIPCSPTVSLSWVTYNTTEGYPPRSPCEEVGVGTPLNAHPLANSGAASSSPTGSASPHVLEWTTRVWLLRDDLSTLTAAFGAGASSAAPSMTDEASFTGASLRPPSTVGPPPVAETGLGAEEGPTGGAGLAADPALTCGGSTTTSSSSKATIHGSKDDEGGQSLREPPSPVVARLVEAAALSPLVHAEGYGLAVSNEGVLEVAAFTPTGLFYAAQSLRQLIIVPSPSAPFPNTTARCAHHGGGSCRVCLPAVMIVDGPRFAWRGLHLDVARHFFSAAFVKKTLDVMALHKLNRFHWHLTDDQGWRLPVASLPRLTSVGAWRANTPLRLKVKASPGSSPPHDGLRYGGFYTREEILDVVAHAASLHISVLPEIEMPGHSLAALAAYPHLGCDSPLGERTYQVGTTWGVIKEVLCPGKESTYDFVQAVLQEVLELFPSPLIHVGGDECPKDEWRSSRSCQEVMAAEGLRNEDELQTYFMSRVGAWLAQHGRSMVGWDEIMDGGTPTNATVMAWRSFDHAIRAANSGHDVIVCPTSHMYFDYSQGPVGDRDEPHAPGFLPWTRVYSLDPLQSAQLTERGRKHILGVQGNVWTEHMHTESHVEYMMHPRLSALAEVAWSSPTVMDVASFKERVHVMMTHLSSLSVNHRPLTKDNNNNNKNKNNV